MLAQGLESQYIALRRIDQHALTRQFGQTGEKFGVRPQRHALFLQLRCQCGIKALLVGVQVSVFQSDHQIGVKVGRGGHISAAQIEQVAYVVQCIEHMGAGFALAHLGAYFVQFAGRCLTRIL